MNICVISTAQIPSTTANSIQVMKACQAMAQNGHNLRLLVPGQGQTAWPELARLYGLNTSFAIEWLPFNPRLRRNDFALKAARQAIGADLVYTWTVQSAVAALLSSQPTLLEVHDVPTGRLGPLWLRMFLRLPGKKCLVLITLALRRALEAQLKRPLPANQLVIAPNGVEPERYQGLPTAPAARAQLGLPQQITVGCTGHLYAGRGAELFLGLAARFPQASFVWVGGREADVTAQRTRAQQAGLSNVTFTGFIPQADVPLSQAAADILLMPYGRSIAGSSGGNSADICSPMKLFDYLAAERAILSSDLPVIREILDDSSAAFAAPEDLASWSTALARLLAEPNLRASLSAHSAEKALQYSWRSRQGHCLDGLL